MHSLSIVTVILFFVTPYNYLIRFGRSFELTSPIEEYKVFYIGMEGASLNNLMLNYNRCQVCVCVCECVCVCVCVCVYVRSR